MTLPNLAEVWLRGPVAGIEPPLLPASHAFLQVVEDVKHTAASLDQAQIWFEIGGAASVGFHLKHIAGSIDRLLTYARGETLSELQRDALANETRPGTPPVATAELIRGVCQSVENALEQLRTTNASTLVEPREVGRAKLPSTVLGLLFHAAEHAQRHMGQITTTVKILHGLSLPQ